MPESPSKNDGPKWQHPADVLKLQKLKLKKRNLQKRIRGIKTSTENGADSRTSVFENVFTGQKRKNPFAVNDENNKRIKSSPSTICNLEESNDQTLFKLLHNNSATSNIQTPKFTSFDNILNKFNNQNEVIEENVEIVKAHGEKRLPIDWTLKSKLRLLSFDPFPWNTKLKLNEEASGITGFTRCLNKNNSNNTYLDDSPNSKFHQCCLYWQQPSLPWLKLFPRSTARRTSPNITFVNSQDIRDSLQNAWFDGLKSLFQLIRTKQCPYFYVCANTFTVLFRAAGVNGFNEVHALITPSTRGFRRFLKSEEIEFKMPLRKKRNSDQGYDTMDTTNEATQDFESSENIDDVEEDEEDESDDIWLQSMGINSEEIKQIKNTQQKIVRKVECAVDNSEQSLILIEGSEVHSFYNFLLNCKSTVAISGPFAGIPPTLLSPVAFNGATLNALKVCENKVKLDNTSYYSIDLQGPILPTTIHNLLNMQNVEHNLTATFHNLNSTIPFSKVFPNDENKIKGEIIFFKENLSDCGMNPNILEQFCSTDYKNFAHFECLKYDSESNTYTWT